MCERYFCKGGTNIVLAQYAVDSLGGHVSFPTSMRVVPAVTVAEVGYTSVNLVAKIDGFADSIAVTLPAATNPKYINYWSADAEL